MAKTGDWNEEVLRGTEVAGRVIHGAVSVGTSAVPLSSTAVEVLWVIVQYDPEGTGFLYVGNSTVTNTGTTRGPKLTPGGESPLIKVDDLSKIYVIASVASQTAFYMAGTRASS